jgi:hypothetical protein
MHKQQALRCALRRHAPRRCSCAALLAGDAAFGQPACLFGDDDRDRPVTCTSRLRRRRKVRGRRGSKASWRYARVAAASDAAQAVGRERTKNWRGKCGSHPG